MWLLARYTRRFAYERTMYEMWMPRNQACACDGELPAVEMEGCCLNAPKTISGEIFVDSFKCPCCKGSLTLDGEWSRDMKESSLVCEECDLHMSPHFALFPPPDDCMQGFCEKHPDRWK